MKWLGDRLFLFGFALTAVLAILRRAITMGDLVLDKESKLLLLAAMLVGLLATAIGWLVRKVAS